MSSQRKLGEVAVGIGGKGNEGWRSIRQLPGSIDISNLFMPAKQNSIRLRADSAHNFIKPAWRARPPRRGSENAADFRISITNPPGKNAYPIAALLVADSTNRPTQQGKILKDFLFWMVDKGQPW